MSLFFYMIKRQMEYGTFYYGQANSELPYRVRLAAQKRMSRLASRVRDNSKWSIVKLGIIEDE